MSTYAADIRPRPRPPPIATGGPVPRWATVAAHLVPLVTLPSALWRLPLALGFSMGVLESSGVAVHVTGWESVYVLALSVVSEGAALLTLGLVRPWGEHVPDWIPADRRPPHPADGGDRARRDRRAGAHADLGLRVPRLLDMPGTRVHDPGWRCCSSRPTAAAAWAPLLAAVTYAYWRRRCRD